MRRGRFIAGVVLIVIGLLLIVAGLVVNSGTTSQNVPAGQAWSLSPSSLTAVKASIHWSGGNTSTTTYLVTGTPECPTPTGVVASGSGASGSLSASLQHGSTYYLFACSGTTFQTATFSLQLSGALTWLDVLAGVAIALGAALAVLGLRRGRLEEVTQTARGAPTPWVPPSRLSSRQPPLTPGPRLVPQPVHVTAEGRTRRGCAVCGAIAPVNDDATCPKCGAPY